MRSRKSAISGINNDGAREGGRVGVFVGEEIGGEDSEELSVVKCFIQPRFFPRAAKQISLFTAGPHLRDKSFKHWPWPRLVSIRTRCPTFQGSGWWWVVVVVRADGHLETSRSH